MFLARVFPPSLIIIAGALLAPTTLAWAQEAPSSGTEAVGLADDMPTPQLKDVAPAPEADAKAAWTFDFNGYMRARYRTVQNDPNYTLIGRHDGFSFADVFLGVDGSHSSGVGFEIAIEAAASLPEDSGNDAGVEVGARLQDGFLYWAPHDLLRVSLGQFKAPFDAESLESSSALRFVDRSVGIRGVPSLEGLPAVGLGQGRQLGLRLDSQPFYFQKTSPEAQPEGLGVSYAVAVTNGRRSTLKYNDNESLAFYGRLDLHWGELLRLGGGAFHNERSLGIEPDLLNETNAGWTGDLQVRAFGLSLLAAIVQMEITPAAELNAEQSRSARSLLAQIAYEEPFFGFEPAYRFAYYDANTAVDAPDNAAYEALTYHTFGLNYNSRAFPIRLMLNYTVTGEEKRSIDNNRFDALAQIKW